MNLIGAFSVKKAFAWLAALEVTAEHLSYAQKATSALRKRAQKHTWSFVTDAGDGRGVFRSRQTGELREFHYKNDPRMSADGKAYFCIK